MAGDQEAEDVQVILTTVNGEQVAAFHMEPQSTVSQVKAVVQEQLGYLPHSQQLLLQGDILEDDTLLQASPARLLLTLVLLPFDKPRALAHAASCGHEAAVRRLLFHAALDHQECLDMLVARTDSEGLTALQKAAMQGHASVCRALLEAAQNAEEFGNIVSAVDRDGWTAAHFAAMNSEAACRALLEAAPSEEARRRMLAAADSAGTTALHVAVKNGERACCSLLEAAPSEEACNAMLTVKDDRGKTALHAAVLAGPSGASEAACRALLGAAPSDAARRSMLSATDHGGSTALHLAAQCNYEGPCRALLAAAPSDEVRRMMLQARNNAGFSPAKVASGTCRSLLEPP